MIPQEVRDLAAGIADDIERNGHYQSTRMTRSQMWTSRNLDGCCCIVQSPSYHAAVSADDLTYELMCAIERIAGNDALTWNDVTPTAEVLATLRKIAAGETP